MFFESYLDESEREGILGVAGYVFTSQQAKKLSALWRPMLRKARPHPVEVLHMTDLMNCKEEFYGYEEADQHNLICRAVEIINVTLLAGAAVSCNIAEFKAMAPRGLPFHKNPYPFLCSMVIASIAGWLAKSGLQGDVAYFFEAGNPYEAQANQLMARVQRDAEVRRQSRYKSHSFLDKRDAVPLQAADVLVWEWTKFYAQTYTTRRRRMRKSLRALLERDVTKYRASHLQGDTLAAYFKYCQKFGWFGAARTGKES